MTNPVLVAATRGSCIESRHRGALAVLDADGATVFAVGDVEEPVFPRSAVKALQALPLVETGAADAHRYGARQLALAQASHGGEPAHVEVAAGMLAAAGLDAGALECGAHWPSHQPSAERLLMAGAQPSALHNNCSGKHAGFLAVARHLGFDHRGYVAADHPVQGLVREALEDVTGERHGAAACGIDGCSIPTYAVPLRGLARGFARFGTGVGLTPGRARAARRLFEAAVAEPWFVAGTGRFCTEVMAALGGAALVKTGAEGVFCAALPRAGIGVALKCDDGAARAAQAMMAAVLLRLLPDRAGALRGRAHVPLRNWRGIEVGALHALDEAFAGLTPPAPARS